MASALDTLDELFASLERPELEPDPARDWTAALPEVAALRARIEEAMAAVEESGDGEARRWCADVAGMLAAACLAAGKTDPARRLLTRAEALAGEGAQRDGFAAALGDPEGFRRMVHDAWRARAAAPPAKRAPSQPPAKRAPSQPPAKRAPSEPPPRRIPTDAPTPGRRGPPEPPPEWSRKSSFAGGWRWLVFVGVLAVIGALSVRSCLTSPERRLEESIAEARAHERKTTPERALRRYERLLDDYAGQKVDVSPVAAEIIRILADRLPRPLTLADAERAERIADRFDAFPENARGRDAAEALTQRILGWTSELRSDDLDHLAAAQRLIARTRGLPVFGTIAVQASVRRAAITRALAERLAADEPQQAFALLVDLDAEGADAAGRILDGLADDPALLRELEPHIRRWLAVAEPLPVTAPRAAALRVRFEAARARSADPQRQALLTGGDAAALRAALGAALHDQEMAAALARATAAEGDAAGAIRALEKLGPPGRLTSDNRLLLASLVADAGDLARADTILTGALAGHEPPVGARVQLAGVKLRRAAVARDPERRTFLEQAERLLLGVRARGGATVEQQIRLGEVYHRLGRPADGDRELQAALAAGTVRDAIDIADIYRALGHHDRARAAVLPRYQLPATPKEEREEIALVISMMAPDVAEEEKWLRLAGDAPGARLNLLTLEGNRLAAEGRRADADAKYAQAAAGFEADATDQASLNNAALVLEKRTEVRGDPAFLERGIQLLEQAVAAHPEDSIKVGNLAAMHWNLARWRLLAHWVDLAAAPLPMRDVGAIVHKLARGRLGGAVAERLRRDPNATRALELLRRTQILSPQTPRLYWDEAEIAWVRRDVAGLRGLLERLATVEIDAIEESEPAAAAPAGDKKDEKEVLHEPPSGDGGAPRTRAVAWLLHARRLNAGGAEDAGLAAYAAYGQAAELWPELGAAEEAAWIRVQHALREAADSDPVFRAEWAKEPEGRDLGAALLRTIEGAQGGAVRATLAASADFRAAAGEALSAGVDNLDLGDYALALALGDAAHIERSAALFRDENLVLRARIDAALDPTDEEARLRRDRLAAGPAPR